MGFSALLRVQQNNPAPEIIDDTPFLDLLERSKAAEADKVIVQAAIPHARGLSGGIDVGHTPNLTHGCREIRAIDHRSASRSIATSALMAVCIAGSTSGANSEEWFDGRRVPLVRASSYFCGFAPPSDR